MATYPQILGTSVQSKKHRMNQTYSIATRPARKQLYETKGPNMFKRIIRGLVTWSMNDNNRAQEEDCVVSTNDEARIGSSGIKFEVYRANGSTVVETRRADRRTGDPVYELHVISGDRDIGSELGKIITLEALKA